LVLNAHLSFSQFNAGFLGVVGCRTTRPAVKRIERSIDRQIQIHR
jgi:hypothetical protein